MPICHISAALNRYQIEKGSINSRDQIEVILMKIHEEYVRAHLASKKAPIFNTSGACQISWSIVSAVDIQNVQNNTVNTQQIQWKEANTN